MTRYLDVTCIPGWQNPSVPKKITGTLTLNTSKNLYILMFPKLLYKLYSLATLNYSKPLLLKNYLSIIVLVPYCQVTRRRVTGRWHNRTWLKSSAVFPGYFVYKGAGPPFARGVAFSLLLIFRVKYTLLLRASSNPLARLLQPNIVLLYNLSASHPSYSVQGS